MTIREIIEEARLAQLHPLQLMLFPPRLVAWEDEPEDDSEEKENG